LKDLANMAEKLKDELKEMGKDPALKRLEQAARAATGNDSQSASGLQSRWIRCKSNWARRQAIPTRWRNSKRFGKTPGSGQGNG